MTSPSFEEQLKDSVSQTYEIERELGGGGMSRVFVATDRSLGRKVVIKLLSPELTAEVNRDRFRREMQVAARFQHPHIVPLLSAGEHGEIVWYTMPFVEGESLKSALEKGPMAVRDVMRVLNNVVDALGYAHARGVIHRDIKPANILRSGNHSLVTDFGIAKALTASLSSSQMTSTGMAIGTPAYMSPEQLAGDPAADHRIDIYAVGLLGYELLNGRSPYASLSPQKVMAAIFNVDPTPIDQVRSDVPSKLSAIIMQCLAKNSEDRPVSADALLDALDGMSTASGQIKTREYRVPDAVAVSSIDGSSAGMTAGTAGAPGAMTSPSVMGPSAYVAPSGVMAAPSPAMAAGTAGATVPTYVPEKRRSRAGLFVGLAAVLLAGIGAVWFFQNNGKSAASFASIGPPGPAGAEGAPGTPGSPSTGAAAIAATPIAPAALTAVDSAAIAQAVQNRLAAAMAVATKAAAPGAKPINADSLKKSLQKQLADSVSRANAAAAAAVAAAAPAPVAAAPVAAAPTPPAAAEWSAKPRLAIAELRENKENPGYNTFARVLIDGLRGTLDKKDSYNLVDQDSIRGVTSRTQTNDEAVRMIQPEVFISPSFTTIGDTVKVNIAVRDMRHGSNYGFRVVTLKTLAKIPPTYYMETLVDAVLQQLSQLPKESTAARR